MERTPPNGFQHKLTVEEQRCQAAALVSGLEVATSPV